MSDRCFNSRDLCLKNSLLLQKIFGFLTKNAIDNLQLRLVNKTFNSEYLRTIRKSHREVHMVNYGVIGEVTINNRIVQLTWLSEYIKFLANVAYVQVEKLRITGSWKNLSDSIKQSIHRDIVNTLLNNQTPKVLIGVAEFCEFGCEDCKRLVQQNQEYGPLQYGILRDVLNKRSYHFKTLIVSVPLLFKIAVMSTVTVDTREECMEMMKSIITATISCDNLQFVFFDAPNQALPLEVITEMLRVWKVKSVGIGFNLRQSEIICSSSWTQKQLFTEFRYNDNYENIKQSSICLEHVELSIERTEYNPFSVRVEHGHSEKYYANNYRMSDSLYSTYAGNLNMKVLEKIIRTVWTDESLPGHRVIVRFRPYLDGSDLKFDFPETIHLDGETFLCEIMSTKIEYHHECLKEFPSDDGKFDETEVVTHVARSVRVTEQSENYVLDLEIYVDKEALKEKEELIHGKEKCFLKLF